MAEFCEQFSMNIANDQDSAEAWTFKSYIGGFYRLDYILHTKNLRSFDVSANYDLDLGSDHRNVSASLEFIRSQESWKKRQTSFKGWKPKLNESWDSQEYHQHLQQKIDESMSSTLHELGQVAIRAAEVGGSSFKGPKGARRPNQSKDLKDLILMRRETKDDYSRKNISKKVFKLARKELRLWKAM